MKDSEYKGTILEYPIKNGLEYETYEDSNRFLMTPTDPYLKTRYYTFKQNSIVFIAYESFAKEYVSKMFTGIYKPLSFAENKDLSIYKKDWIDIIFRTKKIKAGIREIDKYLTFTSENKEFKNLRLSKEFINSFIQLNDYIGSVKIVVKNEYLENFRDFKGKTTIGIETNKWIYKYEDISKLFELGEKLLSEIENVCA
ncbi:MAG: hypothetical protein ACEPOW_14545 [Bacteroidales bacterium]